MSNRVRVKAPGPLLAGTDYVRANLEFGALAVAWPALLRAPSSDGPVLVLPGLGTSDLTTGPLRRTLRGLGHPTHGWGLGMNIGPSERIVTGMRARLDQLAHRYDQPISLVGWSLGGIFARRLARESPDLVRQVITLGSPFKLADHRQTNARLVYKAFSRVHVEELDLPLEHSAGPMPVPSVAMYSRLDGIAPWQVCRDPDPSAENIEVLCSHLGFGHNLPAMWAIADRLATGFDGAGSRPAFVPPTWLRYAFPAPSVADAPVAPSLAPTTLSANSA
jgi:pimeloyl-ACP methyl ester carboxylesterase